MLISKALSRVTAPYRNSKNSPVTNSRLSFPLSIFREFPLKTYWWRSNSIGMSKKISSFKDENRLTILKLLLISGTLLGGLKYRNYISQIVDKFFNFETQIQKPNVNLISNFNQNQMSSNFQNSDTTEKVLVDLKIGMETESLASAFLVSTTNRCDIEDHRSNYTIKSRDLRAFFDFVGVLNSDNKIAQQELFFSNSTLFGDICLANEAPSNRRDLGVCLPRIKNSLNFNLDPQKCEVSNWGRVTNQVSAKFLEIQDFGSNLWGNLKYKSERLPPIFGNKIVNITEVVSATLKKITYPNTVDKITYSVIISGTVAVLSTGALKVSLAVARASRTCLVATALKIHSTVVVLKISLTLVGLVVINLIFTERERLTREASATLLEIKGLNSNLLESIKNKSEMLPALFGNKTVNTTEVALTALNKIKKRFLNPNLLDETIYIVTTSGAVAVVAIVALRLLKICSNIIY
jgi:hypothetical protein